MSTLKKVGALATVGLLMAAMAMPADAQGRKRSGSSTSSGARATPRAAQGGGGQASAPRAAKGSDQARGQRPADAPRNPQGPREGARPRPADAPVTGQAVARPPYRPGGGGGGHYPVYGHGGRYPYYGYRPYYGYPYYGYGYYPGFHWGVGGYYGPYYYSPWIYWSYWNSPAYYYDTYDYGYAGGANLKINVEPKTAEVYVDGYLAGIVDQFDGMFQSLSIEPGDHEITIYQEGFRSISQRLYLSPGNTLRIKGALERLAPGEPNEPRPMRPAGPPSGDVYAPLPSQSQPEPPSPNPAPRYPPPPAPPAPSNPAPESYPPPGDSRYGQVAIRVQPADAEVLIDGETWRAPAGSERLVVSLAPGTHRVEIRREGYDAFVTAIEVRRGETTPLNVSLARF